MYIVSSFEHSLFLELAITDLEKRGVAKEKILAVPLEERIEERNIFDTIHRSDGISLFDGATALGTAFMVLGIIYGFVWKWGPILWALIGLLVGMALGFVLDLFISKVRRKKKMVGNKKSEVILIIDCKENQVEMVDRVLREHYALGIGRVDRPGK